MHKVFNPDVIYGAGDGNRTHAASLEGWNSTIELHPHHFSADNANELYQNAILLSTVWQIFFKIFIIKKFFDIKKQFSLFLFKDIPLT